MGDDAHGATGRWVGLMGFSQGAKISLVLNTRTAETIFLLRLTCYWLDYYMLSRSPCRSHDPRKVSRSSQVIVTPAVYPRGCMLQ